jgi:putative transposase
MDEMTEREHRKKVKHFHEPGHFHELTFSCYRRMPILTNNDWRARLSRHIDSAVKRTSFELVAFVFMPEHVHLLVYPTVPEPEIGRLLAFIKQPFSKEIKQILDKSKNELLRQLTVQERPGKVCFRFWQEGAGFDRNLFTPVALKASIDYIHNNPVKRGLCEKATDWIWSSARFYLHEPLRQQFSELPHLHGLPQGTFDQGNPS